MPYKPSSDESFESQCIQRLFKHAIALHLAFHIVSTLLSTENTVPVHLTSYIEDRPSSSYLLARRRASSSHEAENMGYREVAEGAKGERR